MKQMKNKLKDFGPIWLIAWGLIYMSFLSLGTTTENEIPATVLKYGGLILCFIYVLIHSRTDVFLIIALGLTVVADGVLLFNNVSEIGVGIFILVQATHLMRLSQIRAISPLLTLLISALVVAVGALQKEIPIMFILAAAYGILMFTNIYETFRWSREERSDAARYAKIGFILFLLCDICVAISYLTTTATLPHTVTLLANYMAWVFYLPSQIGLAFSGRKAKFNEAREELPEMSLDAEVEDI